MIPDDNNATPVTAMHKRYPWLTPGVKGIGGASLLADIGHEIPTALLPSLLTSTLGAPASALGAIEGFSDSLVNFPRLDPTGLRERRLSTPHLRDCVSVGRHRRARVTSEGCPCSWNIR